jgi:hypothetical protein
VLLIHDPCLRRHDSIIGPDGTKRSPVLPDTLVDGTTRGRLMPDSECVVGNPYRGQTHNGAANTLFVFRVIRQEDPFNAAAAELARVVQGLLEGQTGRPVVLQRGIPFPRRYILHP